MFVHLVSPTLDREVFNWFVYADTAIGKSSLQDVSLTYEKLEFSTHESIKDCISCGTLHWRHTSHTLASARYICHRHMSICTFVHILDKYVSFVLFL